MYGGSYVESRQHFWSSRRIKMTSRVHLLHPQLLLITVFHHYHYTTIGRSKGGARDVLPTLGPNFFNFMQFWGKLAKIIVWRPHICSWRTPSGKSWIRHRLLHGWNKSIPNCHGSHDKLWPSEVTTKINIIIMQVNEWGTFTRVPTVMDRFCNLPFHNCAN